LTGLPMPGGRLKLASSFLYLRDPATRHPQTWAQRFACGVRQRAGRAR
jgi:hypothetical protein